jgi:hypothetical protein
MPLRSEVKRQIKSSAPEKPNPFTVTIVAPRDDPRLGLGDVTVHEGSNEKKGSAVPLLGIHL